MCDNHLGFAFGHGTVALYMLGYYGTCSGACSGEQRDGGRKREVHYSFRIDSPHIGIVDNEDANGVAKQASRLPLSIYFLRLNIKTPRP